MDVDRDPSRERLDVLEGMYRGGLAEFRRVAAAVSGDREAADDLVQEAFTRAVRGLDRFQDQGSLKGWLWRIVVNVAKNYRRDRQLVAELPAEVPVSAKSHRSSEVERVRAAVASLPERQRLMLFLRYYADLDYSSIAEAVEVSEGTVGATLTAARTSLQQLLLSEEASK